MKQVTEMSTEELKQELDETMKLEPRRFTPEMVDRFQLVKDEYLFKTIYEPKGYDRFQAGQAMFFAGI